jgi:hypothetical protein
MRDWDTPTILFLDAFLVSLFALYRGIYFVFLGVVNEKRYHLPVSNFLISSFFSSVPIARAVLQRGNKNNRQHLENELNLAQGLDCCRLHLSRNSGRVIE